MERPKKLYEVVKTTKEDSGKYKILSVWYDIDGNTRKWKTGRLLTKADSTTRGVWVFDTWLEARIALWHERREWWFRKDWNPENDNKGSKDET